MNIRTNIIPKIATHMPNILIFISYHKTMLFNKRGQAQDPQVRENQYLIKIPHRMRRISLYKEHHRIFYNREAVDHIH